MHEDRELYALPPITDEERARFEEIKARVRFAKRLEALGNERPRGGT
jgi:hypothetical protein